MNQDSGPISSEFAASELLACPTAKRAACSLWIAVASVASGRTEEKGPRTTCEVESFVSLAPGHHVAFTDHETGEFRHGFVHLTFPDHPFVWVYTDVGERKMLDSEIHTIWRPDTPPACGD